MPPKLDESSGSGAIPAPNSLSAVTGTTSVPESAAQKTSADSDAAFMKFCLMIEDRLSKLDSKFEALTLSTISKFEAQSLSEFENLKSPSLGQDAPQGRYSIGSLRTNSSQEINVTKSSFRLKDPKYEPPIDSKTDGAVDDAVLQFFEECERHMETWKSLPENRDKIFQGSENFSLVSLPPSVQKHLAHSLDLVYTTSELVMWSEEEVANAKYWKKATTAQIKKDILVRKAQGIAHNAAVKSIQPPAISWKSGAGLIHVDAFNEYKDNLVTQVSRLAEGGITLSLINVKDAIISAIPDSNFKSELYSIYGDRGSLSGPSASGEHADFSVKSMFEFIRQHILSVKKKGLASVVNRTRSFPDTNHRRFHPLPARSAQNADLQAVEFPPTDSQFWEKKTLSESSDADDDLYASVNASMMDAKSKDCRYAGIGPDGKLTCPYLGKPESAKCGFRHPPNELALKGKGVTKSSPAYVKKAHNITGGLGLGVPYVDVSRPNDSEDGYDDEGL
jgi:hypothetical protein